MTWEAFAAGGAAGFTIAATPGAMSALLLDVAARDGARHALAGGMGIATVDSVYAAVSVVAGGAVAAALDPIDGALRITCAAVLVAVAAINLWRLRRPATAAPPGTAARGYLQFAALTAINPTTLAFFTALVAGAGTIVLSTGEARVLFVGGVLSASAGWHALLAGGGRLLGGLPRRGRACVAVICHVGVVAVAARLVVAS